MDPKSGTEEVTKLPVLTAEIRVVQLGDMDRQVPVGRKRLGADRALVLVEAEQVALELLVDGMC